VIFKKAFSQPDIFKAFVKAVLDIDLEIDTVETEKAFNPMIGNVDSRFDLFAEDVKNRVIVDIQHARYEDHYDRFLHYHCAALLEQIANSKSYRPELKVFTIVVLTSGDRHKKDVLSIDFDPRDLDGKGVNEIAHKVIYLCPKYTNEKTPVAYKEWLEAIQDTLDEQVDESHYHNALIQKIFDSIKKNDITPTERAIMIEEYNRNQLAKKEIQEARDEGLKEGAVKAAQAIAKNLLAAGLSLEQVAQATGLTITDIQNNC
jgi:predicted transposase/invertase (TIGR01784 family)